MAEVARWQGCTREKAMEGRLNELVHEIRPQKEGES